MVTDRGERVGCGRTLCVTGVTLVDAEGCYDSGHERG